MAKTFVSFFNYPHHLPSASAEYFPQRWKHSMTANVYYGSHYPHVAFEPLKTAFSDWGNEGLNYTAFQWNLTSGVTSGCRVTECDSMLSLVLRYVSLREESGLPTPPATTIFPSGQELAFYPLNSVCPFILSNGGLMLLISHVGWCRDQLINVCKELHY